MTSSIWLRWALVWFCAWAAVLPAHAQDGAALQARHAVLRQSLANNPFGRPLHLESSASPGALRGDVFAQVEQPFTVVTRALQGIDHWCDILILHLNVKHCHGSRPKSGDTLSLAVGRKSHQPLAEAYHFHFDYRVLAARPDYLRVALNADAGPLGTSDYRIALEVVPLGARSSFVHLSYSYAYGAAAQLAMQGYLATLGRDKVGFSVVGSKADGQPVYVGSTRGVIERNTMRYYLAIEAYLGALSTPAAQQLDKRLNDWQTGVERYPLQLHELERSEYLDMKHREVRRQRAPDG
jgi:hypothetical protein